MSQGDHGDRTDSAKSDRNLVARDGRPWAAIVAAAFAVLPIGSIYAFSVLLRPLETMLGASRAELTAVFALATVFFTLGLGIGTRLFRAVGPPWLLLSCSLLSALGIALPGVWPSLATLAFGYGVLGGLGGGMAFVVVQQGINQMPIVRRGLVNGYIVSLLPAGAMIAAPLMGAGLGPLGVAGVLLALAASFAITGAIASVLVAVARMPLVEAGPAAGSPSRMPAELAGVFWRLAAAFFLAAASGLMVLSQAAGIVLAYGGSPALALWATTGITAAIACARLCGGWLTDRLPVRIVLAGAQATALSGAIALSLWPHSLVCAPALGALGVGYGLTSGASAAGIAFYWPRALFGLVASRLYVAWCTAAVTLPITAAYLFDLTGGYATAVLIAGAGNVAGLLVALSLPPPAGHSSMPV